jgi:hypothetical protein
MKWPSSESLHHSPPCFSFLLFLSPRFLRRVAPRQNINGYAYRASEFRQLSLWLLFDLMHRVQTFNSLTQSPCTVIVNLMATCDGGSEFFQLFACPGLVASFLLQSTHSRRWPRDTCTMARTVLPTPTCATVIPLDIRSSVHAARAKDRNGLRAAIICSRLSRLTYLSLVGRNG